MYDFPVSLQPVYSHTGEVIPKVKNVFRDDINKSLGVISDKYKLVKHEQVIDAAENFVQRFGRVSSNISLHKDGAIMLAEYTFMDKSLALEKGDVVGLRVYMENSYNGSTSLRFRIGAIVLKCLNGMLIPELITDFAVRHVGKIQVVFPHPDNVIELFSSQKRKWDTFSTIDLGVDGYHKYASRAVVEGAITNTKALTVPAEGTTVWDLYNQFTYFLTRQDNLTALSRMNKLNRLARWMDKTFLERSLV